MAKKDQTEVAKVEKTTEEVVVNGMFGNEGENLLVKTFGQNFKQVKETLIQRKSEDIERVLSRKIQDNIIDLKRKFESLQDDLVMVVPTSPMQTLNLNSIDPRTFCDGVSKWRLDLHKDASKILSDISAFKFLFGKDWSEDEKTFVKSLIIDYKNV